MTETQAKKKWLAWHKANVGYHETGENITKWPDQSTMDEQAYGFSMQGKAWCDYYHDLAYWICFGFACGQRMLYQYGKYGGAACNYSAQFYKDNGAWYTYPQVGDQAFDPSLNHTGAVVAVNDDWTIDRIDGNYSDAVTYRSHVPISQHAGFGRPNWSLACNSTETDGAAEESQDESTEEETQTETFSAGDIVNFKSGAVCYDTGATLNSLVYTKSWIVYSVFRDRVVINKSVDGLNSIWTPVSSKYLTKVSASDATTTTATTSTSSYGIGQAIVEKIQSASSSIVEPVVLNPGKSTFSYGGKRENVK